MKALISFIFLIVSLSALASEPLPQLYFRAASTGWLKQPMLPGFGGDPFSYDHLVTFLGAGPHKFKFDVQGDWAYNFGRDPNALTAVNADSQSGVPFINGAEIEVPEAGTYEIVFTDGSSGRNDWSYRIRKLSELKLESRWPQVFFRGTPNGWNNTPMTLIDHHKWKITVTFSNEPEQGFKFDQSGEWLGGLGEVNIPGRVGFPGGNIAIKPGTYDILLDDRTFEYQVIAKETDSDWRRTLIFIKAPAGPNQELWLRGGIDHQYALASLGRQCTTSNRQCVVPIKHLLLTDSADQNADLFLDWYGVEQGQSPNALGTPLIWTTNNATYPRKIIVDGHGYSPFNRWGDNYWLLDVMMDCSRTVNGWFEFKSYLKGAGWEGNISQAGVPYVSGNHFAQCGMLNRFERGSSQAKIDWLP